MQNFKSRSLNRKLNSKNKISLLASVHLGKLGELVSVHGGNRASRNKGFMKRKEQDHQTKKRHCGCLEHIFQ